ncbi:MAG: hypothetical protein ACE147_13065 [Candidatus Methylomirabilales bacterium]
MAQLAASLVGAWVTASPGVLGYGGAARMLDVTLGPIAASLGLIAAWEATRGLRWGNVAAGAALLLAPWVLSDAYWTAQISHVLAGALLAGFSLLGGGVRGRYGGGWAALFRANEPE